MPRAPDFAVTDATPLTRTDVEFLLRHFPASARRFEADDAWLDAVPATVESMLGSEYVARALLDAPRLDGDVSPFLLFSVLLRRGGERPVTRQQRHVVNYLANLLGLYTDTRRLHRVQPGDQAEYHYLYQLAIAAAQAPPDQEFLAHAQLGNYALFLAGVFPEWIEHRQRYARRPVGRDYYVNLGRAHYRQAAASRYARLWKLDDVFTRLSAGFDAYASALTRMTNNYLPGLAARHGPDRFVPAHG